MGATCQGIMSKEERELSEAMIVILKSYIYPTDILLGTQNLCIFENGILLNSSQSGDEVQITKNGITIYVSKSQIQVHDLLQLYHSHLQRFHTWPNEIKRPDIIAEMTVQIICGCLVRKIVVKNKTQTKIWQQSDRIVEVLN